jgi:hypothetical protein
LTGSLEGQAEYRLARSCRSNRRDKADAGGDNHKACPGLQPKNLVGIPWRVALALQADGWYLRQDIIWNKPNPMPESVTDRCTKAHEYIFLLTKQQRYYFDAHAIQEPATTTTTTRLNQDVEQQAGSDRIPGKTNGNMKAVGDGQAANKRDVWTVSTFSFSGAHFATFPPDLITPCIQAGTSQRGACPICGAPWRRLTKKNRIATRPGKDTKVTGDTMTDGNRDPERHVTTTETVGWEPSCQHGDDPTPAVVLDPFGGAGTTGMVSQRLGRDFVLIELNPAYATMARDRIQADSPLLAGITIERPAQPCPT